VVRLEQVCVDVAVLDTAKSGGEREPEVAQRPFEQPRALVFLMLHHHGFHSASPEPHGG
jgi:hypothetical protein